MAGIVDTHAHIFSIEDSNERKEQINKAINAGLEEIFMPNIDLNSIESMLDTEKEFPAVCKPMLGLHPSSVTSDYEIVLDQMEQMLDQHKYYAIGETGIDLYWEQKHFNQQVESLKRHAAWAIKSDLPIILHTRNAFNETYEVMNDYNGTIKGIFHCFTGSTLEAEKVINLGFKLGIGGVLTFKNSGLDKTVADIPIENMVLETDTPYLAPVPYRGKPNQPAYIVEVAKKLAEIKKMSYEEVVSITTKTAKDLFYGQSR